MTHLAELVRAETAADADRRGRRPRPGRPPSVRRRSRQRQADGNRSYTNTYNSHTSNNEQVSSCYCNNNGNTARREHPLVYVPCHLCSLYETSTWLNGDFWHNCPPRKGTIKIIARKLYPYWMPSKNPR